MDVDLGIVAEKLLERRDQLDGLVVMGFGLGHRLTIRFRVMDAGERQGCDDRLGDLARRHHRRGILVVFRHGSGSPEILPYSRRRAATIGASFSTERKLYTGIENFSRSPPVCIRSVVVVDS